MFPTVLCLVSHIQWETQTCKIMFQNSWATTAIHIWIVVQLVMRDFKDPLLLDCCSTYLGLDVIMKSCLATVVRHFWICGESVSDTMLNNNLSWSGLGLIRIHKRREMVHLWVRRAFRTDTKQAFHYFSMAFALKDVDRSERRREEKKGGRKDHTKSVEARAEVHGSCDLHWASVSISKSSPPTTTIEIKVTFFQSSFNSFLHMKWHDFFI